MRGVGQLIAVLMLAGLVLHYFWWIAAAGALIGSIWLAGKLADQRAAAAAERAARDEATAARADRQHALVLTGDEAGVYGDYPPAV